MRTEHGGGRKCIESLEFAITVSIINFQPGAAGPSLQRFTAGRGPETGIILKAALCLKLFSEIVK